MSALAVSKTKISNQDFLNGVAEVYQRLESQTQDIASLESNLIKLKELQTALANDEGHNLLGKINLYESLSSCGGDTAPKEELESALKFANQLFEELEHGVVDYTSFRFSGMNHGFLNGQGIDPSAEKRSALSRTQLDNFLQNPHQNEITQSIITRYQNIRSAIAKKGKQLILEAIKDSFPELDISHVDFGQPWKYVDSIKEGVYAGREEQELTFACEVEYAREGLVELLKMYSELDEFHDLNSSGRVNNQSTYDMYEEQKRLNAFSFPSKVLSAVSFQALDPEYLFLRDQDGLPILSDREIILAMDKIVGRTNLYLYGGKKDFPNVFIAPEESEDKLQAIADSRMKIKAYVIATLSDEDLDTDRRNELRRSLEHFGVEALDDCRFYLDTLSYGNYLRELTNGEKTSNPHRPFRMYKDVDGNKTKLASEATILINSLQNLKNSDLDNNEVSDHMTAIIRVIDTYCSVFNEMPDGVEEKLSSVFRKYPELLDTQIRDIEFRNSTRDSLVLYSRGENGELIVTKPEI